MDDDDIFFMDGPGGFDAVDVGVTFGLAGALMDHQTNRLLDAQQQGHCHPAPPRPVTINAAPDDDDDELTWDDFVGQENLKRRLRIHINSAKARGVALDHTLLASGRPGVGKTTMGKIIAQEMGGQFFMLVPPFHRDALHDAVRVLEDGDVLFIDEIHKLADHGKAQAENLLHIMEERALYLPEGVVKLADFTLVGATTDADKLPETIIDRFRVKPHYEEYSHDELRRIVRRFEKVDGLFIPMALRETITHASRKTPRVIGELVVATRDLIFSLNELPSGMPNTLDEKMELTYPSGAYLLEFMSLTPEGLTPVHREYITGIYRAFGRDTDNGRVYVAGEMSLVTMMRMPKQGLARLERELIELGFVDRTPQGRKLTPKGVAAARKWSAK
jgi:holliday junction DNA helicase RuvB